MSSYTQVLAAIDLNDEGQNVLSRAGEFARASGARLTILHVVEFFPSQGAVGGPIDLTEERAKKARETLAQWAVALGTPATATEVVIGTPTTEVLRTADRLGADLLVVGHHPHRGIAAYISHTDASVLNRANCDVLAVAQRKRS